MSLENIATNYLKKYDENTSVEELFIEFKELFDLHMEFENYLKKEKLNKSLNRMRRDKRLLEKRKLFCKWFFEKNAAKGKAMPIVNDLSELTFVSERTVFRDLFTDTTD